MQSHTPAVESLERRALFAADLVNTDAVTHLEVPIVLPPGESGHAPYSIRNDGDTHVTETFTIEYRLIPLAPGPIPPLLDFHDATTIIVAQEVLEEDVEAGKLGVSGLWHWKQPADLSPGRYALMNFLDATNVVAETNESNNHLVMRIVQVLTSGGILLLDGTNEADHVLIWEEGGQYQTNVNGAVEFFWPERVKGFSVRADGGDDVIELRGNPPNVRADGGDGNDKIAGGGLNDLLIGGAGKDTIDGGGGNDRLNGNGGHDKLIGGAGADRIYGYAGNDYLDGGSSGDRLEGGTGTDTILGQSGNDRFFTIDALMDELFGGGGTDSALADPDDVRGSIETLFS